MGNFECIFNIEGMLIGGVPATLQSCQATLLAQGHDI